MSPERVFTYVSDITSLKSASVIEQAAQDMGGIGTIIICSGVGHINAELSAGPEIETVKTNVLGFTDFAAAAYNYFANALAHSGESGTLAGISSIASFRGSDLAPSYYASKAYVGNYLEGLRKKAVKNKLKLNVCTVIPGFVDTAFERDMENVCRHYSEMGVKGFKIDFMDRCDQKMMAFLEKAAATCAKYRLFCDFHGAPVPNGMTYTYPNVLNFEAVAGQEQVKWSKLKKFDQVRHETLLPFIRQVVGPMDYTQGAMRNATKKSYYPCNSQPMNQGTRCRQLALYLIFDSPFNMLCDTPTNYEAEPECLDFISKVPVVWDERRVLSAKVGEYVIEACRKGDTWYVGGITNWEARTVNLDLSFIEGKQMELFVDGINAHRHAEDYKKSVGTVPATLSIHLAPGGGFALKTK